MTTPAAPFIVHGSCYRQPYSQAADTRDEAVFCAAVAIGWNLWHPKEVRDCDGNVVMGAEELWERAFALDL